MTGKRGKCCLEEEIYATLIIFFNEGTQITVKKTEPLTDF
jgi:hypothetical protein